MMFGITGQLLQVIKIKCKNSIPKKSNVVKLRSRIEPI